jgi:hypothetical protein
VNHDGESVDRQSDLGQGENRHLWWENHAYARDEHHDESMGRHQSVQAQDHSIVNQNHMSDGQVHEKNETRHEKK